MYICEKQKERQPRCPLLISLFAMDSDNVMINLSHAYEELGTWECFCGERIDATGLQGTDCYCDDESAARIREWLLPFGPQGVHWIDSGNYHYLTRFWAEKVERPFSMILFDHHPDMQLPRFEGLLSCGGWLRTLLEEQPQLQRACIVGVAPHLKEHLAGFEQRVVWLDESLCDDNGQCLYEGLDSFLHASAGQPFYLSVDKDVLSPDYARTNWDQGSMSLPVLLRLLSLVMATRRVIGVDICGELTEGQGSTEGDRQVNVACNSRLQQFFDSYGAAWSGFTVLT